MAEDSRPYRLYRKVLRIRRAIDQITIRVRNLTEENSLITPEYVQTAVNDLELAADWMTLLSRTVRSKRTK